MLARSLIRGTVSLWVLTCCWLSNPGWSQDAAAPAPAPPVPQGVEVLSRGPVHEAFASLTAEPMPTKAVAKQPPNPLTEMPPEDKPEGNVIWIGGYWAWDDDRADYLWVSGIWRSVPPGKKWVAGYWKDNGNSAWQWIPGFWTAAVAPANNPTEQITYLPGSPRAARSGLPRSTTQSR